VIEVARNRCIIRGEKGFRSPVMAEAFFFSSHFFSPYSEDHKPTLDDEKIIREVISANNIFRMPVPYEKYHLFTEEEYGRLDVETKKRVLFMEIADGTVVYIPWYMNQDNSI
jgi:hypothetical protein